MIASSAWSFSPVSSRLDICPAISTTCASCCVDGIFQFYLGCQRGLLTSRCSGQGSRSRCTVVVWQCLRCIRLPSWLQQCARRKVVGLAWGLNFGAYRFRSFAVGTPLPSVSKRTVPYCSSFTLLRKKVCVTKHCSCRALYTYSTYVRTFTDRQCHCHCAAPVPAVNACLPNMHSFTIHARVYTYATNFLGYNQNDYIPLSFRLLLPMVF